jgi:hypothetical protein
MPGSRRLALSLFVDPDTTTDLASLGVLLGGFAAGVAAAVAHRRLGEGVPKRLDQAAGTDRAGDLPRELVDAPAGERIAREILIREYHR